MRPIYDEVDTMNEILPNPPALSRERSVTATLLVVCSFRGDIESKWRIGSRHVWQTFDMFCSLHKLLFLCLNHVVLKVLVDVLLNWSFTYFITWLMFALIEGDEFLDTLWFCILQVFGEFDLLTANKISSKLKEGKMHSSSDNLLKQHFLAWELEKWLGLPKLQLGFPSGWERFRLGSSELYQVKEYMIGIQAFPFEDDLNLRTSLYEMVILTCNKKA